MKRVLVIANNLKQASFRLRIAALVGPLAERGFELKVMQRPRSLLPRRQLLREARNFDAVILQRKLLDPWDAKLLRRSARRIFYDIDDAVMCDEKPLGLLSRWRNSQRFEATASVVDHVVAGSAHLARFFQERGQTVTIIPTVVDPAQYQLKRHEDAATPTLVWIGSHSTLPYLREQLPQIESAAQRVRGLRLLTIADATVTDAKLPVEHVAWSQSTESASLLRGDVGIAPTPLNQWTLGKCGFKIVQYMAAGLPVIASPVGANVQIVVDGVTGFLPNQPGEWMQFIEQLAGDAALRARMGAAGRSRVEREFALPIAVQTWARLLGE